MIKRASTTNLSSIQELRIDELNVVSKAENTNTVHTSLRPGPRWVLGWMARWSTR